MSTSSQNTNKLQFAYLVDWMCSHPYFARGQVGSMDTIVKFQLEQMVTELNNLGPPVKSMETWRKVWTDFRKTTRRKFQEDHSKAKSHRFSDCESRIIELLDMKNEDLESTTGIRKVPIKKTPARAIRIKMVESVAMTDDDDDEDEMALSSFARKADTLNDEHDNAAMEIENPLEATEISNTLKEKTTTSKDNTHTPSSSSGSSSAPTMVRVLLSIEKQLERLNEQQERHSNLMEENNKLLKLLIYRSTNVKSNGQVAEDCD